MEANRDSSKEDFKIATRERLLNEHPDLADHWLPLIDDPDPYGRLFGYPALWNCMEAIDAHKRAVESTSSDKYQRQPQPDTINKTSSGFRGLYVQKQHKGNDE